MLSGQFLGSIKLREDDVLTKEDRIRIRNAKQLCSFNMIGPQHRNVLKPHFPFYPVSFFLDGNTLWFASATQFCSVKFKFDRTEVVCLNRTIDDMTSLGQFRLLSIMRYGDLIVFTTGTHGYQIYDRETGQKMCDLWWKRRHVNYTDRKETWDKILFIKKIKNSSVNLFGDINDLLKSIIIFDDYNQIQL